MTKRARKPGSTDRRLSYQSVLADFGQSALAVRDLEKLLAHSVELAAEALDVPYAKILELLPDGKALRLRAGVGWSAGLVGNACVGAGVDSQAGYTLLSDRPVIVADLANDARFRGPHLLVDHGVVSGMSVIIRGERRPFGIFGVHTREHRAFGKHDADFLQGLANVVGLAIQRARADEELHARDEEIRLLVDQLPGFVWSTDADFRVITHTGSGLAAIGLRPNQFAGVPIREYFGDEWEPRFHGMFRRALSGEERSYEMEWRGRTFHISMRPRVDRIGRPVGVIGVNIDVTDLRSAQLEANRKATLYRDLFDGIPIGVYRAKPDGRIEDANPAFCRMAGVADLGELLRRNIVDFYQDAQDRAHLRETLERQGYARSFESEMRDARGKPIAVSINARLVRDASGEIAGYEGIVEDISRRRAAEQQAARINRLYSVRSQVNQSIVRERDAIPLLEGICRIAVEEGGMRLAWVGRIDAKHDRLTPVARFGFDDGYVDTIVVSTDTGIASRGPSGRAARSGRTVACADIENDPAMAPWRDAALKRGFRSSAAVPLAIDGRIEGVLNFYAPQPGFFTGEELALLEALAADVSFALEAIAHEAERRELESQHDRLRQEQIATAVRLQSLLDSTGEAIYGNDVYDICTFANRALGELLGYSPEEIVGRSMHSLMHHTRADGSRYPEEECPVLLAIRTGEGHRADDELLWRRDGSSFPAEYSSFPIRVDGRVTGAVVTVVDITERKRAEAELREALRRAEAADRLKTAFLANMSHEIRTPLNVILGYSDLLELELPPEQVENHRPLLETIRRASERLLDTIHAVLDLAKLESRTYRCDPGPLRIAGTVERILKGLSEAARNKGLALTLRDEAPDAELFVDEHCMQESLRQLVSNAIKFTNEGGVTVRSTRDEERRLVIEIRDSGIGIDPAYLPHLFEPFSQEDPSEKRQFEGSGLGLALAKRLLELCGANLRLESTKGIGTTAVITFEPSSELGSRRGSGTGPPRSET